VVAELSGEKIDVIPWSDDPAVFVANALSPAQVISVDIDEEHRIASVTVPERMLSLAIGREGQNARLAARLTGWRIDIRSDVSVAEARAAATETANAARAKAATTPAAPAAPVAEAAPTVTPAAGPKPKRTTKKTAAEAALVAEGAAGDAPQAVPATSDAAAPTPKPKRATRKAATPSEGVAS
jgi:N utilization substance protein A